MDSPLSRNSQFDLGYQAEDATQRVRSMDSCLPRSHVDDRDLSLLDGIAVGKDFDIFTETERSVRIHRFNHMGNVTYIMNAIPRKNSSMSSMLAPAAMLAILRRRGRMASFSKLQ
jgi:hypothetical protein